MDLQNRDHLDRDEKAAKNILKEGLKIISAGRVDYADGDGAISNTQLSAKPEACLPLENGYFKFLVRSGINHPRNCRTSSKHTRHPTPHSGR